MRSGWGRPLPAPSKSMPGMDHTRVVKRYLSDVAIAFLALFCLPSAALLIAGVSPFAAFCHLFSGVIGSWSKISHVLSAWTPLTLCACGLLYTFRINLWNIGVEGQIILGAVFATAVLRWCPSDALGRVWLMLSLLAGAGGGILWGLLAGQLKTRGGINEIFSGLGLNFAAQGLVLWLVFGPWKRLGTASMSGTEPFPAALWLPRLWDARISPTGLILLFVVAAATGLVLMGTGTGLRLKAIGSNPRAAHLYGLSRHRNMLLAMACSGGIAGLVGSLQITDVYHRLLPAISSNYGYLSLLVAMVAGYRMRWIPLASLLFACLNHGSIQLPMNLGIDSSFAGVMQGLLVLTILGLHGRHAKGR